MCYAKLMALFYCGANEGSCTFQIDGLDALLSKPGVQPAGHGKSAIIDAGLAAALASSYPEMNEKAPHRRFTAVARAAEQGSGHAMLNATLPVVLLHRPSSRTS